MSDLYLEYACLRFARYTVLSINFCIYLFLLFNVVYTYYFAFPYIYRDILSFYFLLTSIHCNSTYTSLFYAVIWIIASLFIYIIANLWNLCLLTSSWISRFLLYIFFMTFFINGIVQYLERFLIHHGNLTSRLVLADSSDEQQVC